MPRRSATPASPKRQVRIEDALDDYMQDTSSHHTNGSNSSEVRPLVPLELELQLNPQQTSKGDSWRLLAGILLSCLVFAPFYVWYRGPAPARYAGMVCSNNSTISLSQMYENVATATNWCKDGHESCKCGNPLMPQKYAQGGTDEYKKKWDVTAQENYDLVEYYHDFELDFVLLGDSITEHWRGTDLGVPAQEYDNITSVYKDYFITQCRGVALGIAGDGCSQLQWRLLHNAEAKMKTKVWWILIGTNDLGRGCTFESVIMGILEIVECLKNKDGIIVLNSVLPRDVHKLQIQSVNEALECYAKHQDNKVHFVDTTDLFVKDGAVSKTLMPDGLHPSVEGSRLWGKAIANKVQELKESNR